MTFDIEHWEMNKSGVERRGGECIFTTTGAGYRAQEGMAMLVEKYRNIRGQNTTVTSFAAWKLPLCMKRKRYESMREALCINVWIWNTLKYSLGSAGLQLAQCARNCLNNSLNSAIRISAGPGWACSLYTLYAIELWRFFAEFSQCIEKACDFVQPAAALEVDLGASFLTREVDLLGFFSVFKRLTSWAS